MDEIINLTLSQDQITARFKNSTKNFSRILMVSEHSRKAKCCMDLSLWVPPANFKTNQTFWGGGGGMRTRKIGLQTLYRSGWGETVQKPALTSQRSLRNTGIHNRERIGQNSKSQMHFFGDKQDYCSENCTPPRGPCITALEDTRKLFMNDVYVSTASIQGTK